MCCHLSPSPAATRLANPLLTPDADANPSWQPPQPRARPAPAPGTASAGSGRGQLLSGAPGVRAASGRAPPRPAVPAPRGPGPARPRRRAAGAAGTAPTIHPHLPRQGGPRRARPGKQEPAQATDCLRSASVPPCSAPLALSSALPPGRGDRHFVSHLCTFLKNRVSPPWALHDGCASRATIAADQGAAGARAGDGRGCSDAPPVCLYTGLA